jgi:predicted RNase H-like nuclease (RuvC/YqgF family)
MKVKDIQREEEFHDMNAKVDSLKARLATVTQQKNHLEAVNNEKISSLQSSLASIKQQLLKKQRCSDDASSTSSKTSKSHLKQMVVELEDSVDAIKNHYENKVRTLQHALNSARKKMEKYERKISDLTTLLEENASVVDVLHKKLKMNNRHQVQETRSPVRSPKSEETVESEVSS